MNTGVLRFNGVPEVGEYKAIVPDTFNDITKAWAKLVTVEVDGIDETQGAVTLFSTEQRVDEPAITATVSKLYEIDVGLERPKDSMYFEHTSGIFFVSLPGV